MPTVNPEILAWARNAAGLSLDAAAQKLGIQPASGVSPTERLAALEEGSDPPSRPMLVKMAHHYRRPLLLFYMAAPLASPIGEGISAPCRSAIRAQRTRCSMR